MDFSQSDLVKNALHHAEAEAGFDMEGTLATLEAEPVYDLMPIGLRMAGMDRARRYYEHYFADVAPRIIHFALVAEWSGRMASIRNMTLSIAMTMARNEPTESSAS